MTSPSKEYDYLIVGSGLGGLVTALELPEKSSIALITKSYLKNSNSSYAQGGISCVMNKKEDSFEQHINDTLLTGVELCHKKHVTEIIEKAPNAIQFLINLGVQFSKNENKKIFSLGKEGGHTQRRVLHYQDITGEHIIEILIKEVLKRKNITLYEEHIAIEIICTHKLLQKIQLPNQCLGAYILNKKNNLIQVFKSQHLILSTGGAGKVYRNTTNPSIATGDGIAMAYHAGLIIENMEFFQFHPTSLCVEGKNPFLISEAVRGEGAKILVNKNGKYYEFMSHYHPLGNLAPRDIVARAIDTELKKNGQKTVYLDLTHLDKQYLKKRFPKIYTFCQKNNIYLEKDFIPIVPAAHYCCGGVKANINGKTELNNLWVIGETASTGLHGANRLASNSLLETLVMSIECTKAIKALALTKNNIHIPKWISKPYSPAKEQITISHNWSEIRSIMWDYVGIFRSTQRLGQAKKKIAIIRKEVEGFYWKHKIDADLIELRNILTIAELITNSALKRKESRGLHYNTDFPKMKKKAKITQIKKK